MYGLVHKALESMVRARLSDSQWEEIKARAGVTSLTFISNEPYPDDVTYSLVGAIAQELEVTVDEFLEAFGEYWVLETASESYPDLMASAGRSLPDFLLNLNNLHVRVGMLFPKLSPPHFSVTDRSPGRLLLHHHTHRAGLGMFVKGLLIGLGKKLRCPAHVTLVESRAQGATHDVFEVTWKET